MLNFIYLYGSKFLFLFLVGAILLKFTSCAPRDSFPVGKKLLCDAEHINEKGKFIPANDSSFLFDGGNKQTSIKAHTRSYSVYTTPGGKAYAFGFSIKKAGPNWYFKLSVWRKAKDGKGALVASAKDTKVFYQATSDPIETDENGWEKLEMEVYTPPTFNRSEIVFYVWNNGTDSIFFDNFRIERLAKKKYPQFKEDPLSIILDSSEYLKIINKRKEAFTSGILQTSDDDWVKAIVFGNGDMMKARIRLKGDWLDHLRGDKWSFRIKMRKSYSWNHLRTFSVQTPLSRGFLDEWISHKFYDAGNILTTRYGFVPLIFNNELRGLYAWEEHFEKQLLESRNRREGPILKFTEEAFWQVQKINIYSNQKWPVLPYYQAAVIKPFKQSKTIRDPILRMQFFNAQKLVQQYKNHLLPPAEIFDLNKLAKYYAMLEITQARHGIVWHNQRFYFNPVLCKLEPIAFDGFAGYENLKPGINNNYAYMALNARDSLQPHDFLIYNLFTDSMFINKYIRYLKHFSSSEFIQMNSEKIKPEMLYYDSLLRLEFPYIKNDVLRYSEVAADIRSYIPELERIIKFKHSDPNFKLYCKKPVFSDSTVFEDTPAFFVNAYLEETMNGKSIVSIYNYYPGDIIILGTGANRKNISSFQHPEPKIKAYHGDSLRSTLISADTGTIYLFMMTPNRFESYVTEILPWPYPKGFTSQQELKSNSKLENYSAFIKQKGMELVIPAGDHTVSQPIIIPKGYTLKFERGAKLDLTDSAMFISYSPIEIQGTEDAKVVITSSDFSAKGFTVLQAEKRSIINHAIFENLNTLNFKGWTLTGAVTFYESDVDISNTLFYRNQCEDALNTIRSDFKLEKSTFEHIYGDAFDSDFCTGLVSNCKFNSIGNDAIDFSGSQIKILDTEIIEAKDKGISGGEDSYLTVENTTILRSNIGLASKDLSTVDVKNSSIIDCNYGIVLLQKKPEYGPAKMTLTNTLINNAKTIHLIEIGSEVVIEGKLIKGDRKNLADIFY